MVSHVRRSHNRMRVPHLRQPPTERSADPFRFNGTRHVARSPADHPEPDPVARFGAWWGKHLPTAPDGRWCHLPTRQQPRRKSQIRGAARGQRRRVRVNGRTRRTYTRTASQPNPRNSMKARTVAPWSISFARGPVACSSPPGVGRSVPPAPGSAWRTSGLGPSSRYPRSRVVGRGEGPRTSRGTTTTNCDGMVSNRPRCRVQP